MTEIYRSYSRAKVILYSRYGTFDLSHAIFELSTTKDISAPAGQWSFSCVPLFVKDTLPADTLLSCLLPSTPKVRPDDPAIINDLFLNTAADDYVGIWLNVAYSADSVDIGFGTTDPFIPDMMGPVSTVTQQMQVGPEGPTYFYTVTGEDWGKIFLKTDCWIDPVDGKVGLTFQPAFAQTTGLQSILGKTSEIIPKVAAGFLLNLGQWTEIPSSLSNFISTNNLHNEVTWNPGDSYETLKSLYNAGVAPTGQGTQPLGSVELTKYILTRIGKTVKGYYNGKQIGNGNPNLWGLLKEISNEAINELWVDWVYFDDPTKVYPLLTCRRAPFDQEDFKKLESVEISSTRLLAKNVARSDREMFNYFNVTHDTLSMVNQNLNQLFPYRNDASMKKHGRRRMVKKVDTSPELTPGQTKEKGKNEGLIAWLTECTKTLAGWYQYNHQLLSGTITIMGDPRVRVGKRLDIKTAVSNTILGTVSEQVTEQYYIERVEQSYTVLDGMGGLGSLTTTLQVTRGIIRDVIKLESEDVAFWKKPHGDNGASADVANKITVTQEPTTEAENIRPNLIDADMNTGTPDTVGSTAPAGI